jgi:tellurite resistance protein
MGTELYDLMVSPWVRALSNEVSAKALVDTSPMRMQRWLESDRNPLMMQVQGLAETVREQRRVASTDNPFRQAERAAAGLVTQWWDTARDVQNAMIEWNFHLVWGTPAAQSLGEPLSRTVSEAPREDLRTLTSVQDALDRIELGDFADGVIRMLIFLAHSRREVRRSRLERSNRMLMATEPFASMNPKHRTRMIHKESLIVGYEPEMAMAALPKLIASKADRRRAMSLCEEIAGSRDEMSPETIAMLDRLARVLELEPVSPLDDAETLRKIA